MYDELVKALRVCADGEHCSNCSKWELKLNAGRNACEYAICTEAADVIEQLTADFERSREWETFWEKEANEALRQFQLAVANKPRWIPVTERLPEEWWPVLGLIQFHDEKEPPAQQVLWYLGNGHWRETWRGDMIESDVTHWMPLPEPPKEE